MPSDQAVRNWILGAQHHRIYVVFRLKGQCLQTHREFVRLTCALGRVLRTRAAQGGTP